MFFNRSIAEQPPSNTPSNATGARRLTMIMPLTRFLRF
jgi:hypothetical protein